MSKSEQPDKLKALANALTVENEALIKENEALKADAEKSDGYLTQLTVLKSDFENFKNRTRTVSEIAKDEGKIFVIEKLLPVLDTFYRAQKNLAGKAELNPFNMVLKQFEKILGEVGITELNILGSKFDPDFAEALTKEEVKDEKQKGVVLEVYSKGYAYKDKIVRHAQVKVGV